MKISKNLSIVILFLYLIGAFWWLAKGHAFLFGNSEFYKLILKEIRIDQEFHYRQVLSWAKFLALLIYPVTFSYLLMRICINIENIKESIKETLTFKSILYAILSPFFPLILVLYFAGIQIIVGVFFMSLPIIAIWYFREDLKNLKTSITVILIVASIFTLLFGSRIRDGFTPVDILTEEIYENSVYQFNGSVCRDGTISSSQGRGTCSWHRGVKYKFYKGQHKKTKEECRVEAKERSWLE